MNILSLLYIFTFIIFLFFGTYVIYLYRKSKLKGNPHTIFFITCLFFSAWSFNYAFLVSAANKSESWFWFKMSIPELCLFPALLLHFFHYFTKKDTILNKYKILEWLMYLIYIPGIIFIIKGFTGELTVKDFIRKPYGWEGVHATDSIWYFLHMVYYVFYIICCIILTINWRNRVKSIREKKQAELIIITSIASLLINFVIESLLPFMNIPNIPRIAQIVTLIWVFGIWFAMVKYKLMSLTPEMAVEEMMSKILDILILVDTEKKIIKVNRQAINLLGYNEKELLGKKVECIFSEEELILFDFEKMKTNIYPEDINYYNLKTKSGDRFLACVSGSAIFDKNDEIIGVILVAFDQRPVQQLEKEIIKRKLAEEKLQSMNTILEKKVEERTEDIKQTNIILISEIEERKKSGEQLYNAYTKLKSIFEVSPYAIIVTDLEGNIEDCNEALIRVNGTSKNDLVNKNVLNFIANRDHEMAKNTIREIINNGSIKNKKLSLLNKSGKEIPSYISSNLIKDYWGKAVGFVTIIISLRDIDSIFGKN